ncbi:MAG: hypothetical protein WA791_14065 [Rhodomicrobium sp.]
MPESWRNILERAASNLSIELDGDAAPVLRQQPSAWPAPRRHSQKPNFPMESRDLLARELEAMSKPSRGGRQRSPQPGQTAPAYPVAVYKEPITQTVRQPTRPSRKGNPGRELAALSISVMIVVLAVYGFFWLLH